MPDFMPIHGDKVILKSYSELIANFKRRSWFASDIVTEQVANKYGGSLVTVQHPQNKDHYFFVEGGHCSFHLEDIEHEESDTFADMLIDDMENGRGLAKENLEKKRSW